MRKTFVDRFLVMFLIAAAYLLCQAPPSLAGDEAAGDSITVTGELTVLYGDDFANHRSELIHVVEDAKSKKKFKLKFHGKPPTHLRSGAIITARGKAKGKELFVELDEDGGESLETLLPAAASVGGEQNTLVLVADFVDASVSCSMDSIQDLMFTDSGDYSVDDLYQETSLGQLWFAGNLAGPYTIDFASTDACDYSAWAAAAEAAAQADGVNLSTYSRKIYVLPSANQCGWAGLGTVGGNPSRAWIVRCTLEDVFAHELGHNFGMHHSSTPTNEYGDTSDIMGYGGLSLRQVNGPHREQMGWIAAEQILNVTESGTYYVAPLELDAWQALGPQVLKIAKPDSNEYYYLSYRQELGFDVNLSASYTAGLTVHRYAGSGSSSRTYLLDVLADGESFVDAGNGVTVTQHSQTLDLVTVSVQLGTVCNPGAPTLGVLPSTQSAAPGTALTYTVSVTNADGSSCGQSTFDLAPSLPAGWTATLSPAALTLSPGESGAATLSATSPSGASDGAYGFNVDVSDAVEPAHTASVAAGYVVVTPCSPAAPTLTMSPDTQDGLAGATLDYSVTVANTDDSSCGQSTFDLTRSLPAGWTGTFSPAALILSPGETGAATLSVTSTPAAPDGAYGLSVAVSDAAEPTHTASAAAGYVVMGDSQPPTAPTGLSANVKRKQVQLSWTAAVDNVGVSGYAIWRNGVNIANTVGTRYTDSSPGLGAIHEYRVVAHDAAGNTSNPSNVVTVTMRGGGKGDGGGKGKKK